jgi:hypothetical protein
MCESDRATVSETALAIHLRSFLYNNVKLGSDTEITRPIQVHSSTWCLTPNSDTAGLRNTPRVAYRRKYDPTVNRLYLLTHHGLHERNRELFLRGQRFPVELIEQGKKLATPPPHP